MPIYGKDNTNVQIEDRQVTRGAGAGTIYPTPGVNINLAEGSAQGEIYELSYDVTTQKIILTDSRGVATEVDAGATEVGFLPIGHDDHSGADNEGELIIGRGGQTIYRMVVGLEEADTIPAGGDNSLIDKNSDGGELIFQLSSLVQAGDKRPPTTEAVQTAISTLGPGDHITTTGTGDFVTGVTVNEAGNVTTLSLNDGDTVLRNIGAQQSIDGVFFASTAAQRAMDPPRGELAFYANVGGTPTREHTQPLEVIGMRGSGTAVHTFDDGASLWFEVEIVGAGEGGGGGTVTFATSDDWEAQDGLTLQLDEYVSADEDYVPVRADAELRAAGYEAGDSFFITERDIEYQVIITSENFALQYVISNRDTIAELSGGQGVLDDISDNATNIATNTADIESVVQHNHEQDARIAALENQDFTTTISSFTESTTLSNLFTSGTVINKGNAGSNLYQAWTVTREGHELIGYLQLTDTERDTFRNEFSLIQGSSSNIYIPANPDSPHTIGIKAFPAADFNDLSSSTQVMLGQISSMRFGGNVGSETMFEIRWELLNYSDAIDTGLGTVDSGEIYGAAGDKRYAFLAPTIYTAPAWEFREATVSRTEIINTGTAVSVNGSVVNSPNFLDNADADGIHIEVTNNNEIKFNLNHLPGAAYSSTITYDPGDEVTFNGTIYIALSNQTGVAPIDGGSSNNVFHGTGGVPSGSGFAWRIAKAAIIVGTFDPETNVASDEAAAESLHFNSDHFITTVDLTSGNEDISLNPDVIGGGGGSTVRVDGVEVDDPNFVDNGISTTTARGVAFGADAQGNIIGQVDVTGLSGMGESALAGNTVGSLVKVNVTQDGFDDAVAGTDYQSPLTADVDYQTPLAAGVDYQTPIQASDIEGVATDVVVNTWSIEQVENLDTMLTALAITDPSNIGLFVNGQAYRIGDNFVEANTLYRVLSAGAYASFDAIIAANAAAAIGTFTINQTNNTFNSVTFTATVTDDAGTSVNLSNISYDIPTTTITVTGTTESGGGGVISSLTIDIGAAARAAVAGTPINLSAASTVNDSVIITQELVDVAVDTGDFVIVDNVLQINNGITSPGFVSFVRVNGFLGVRQEASDDTRDIYIVSYRGATHTVYFFKADSTWRSSDSTADNTNIITPLIGG